MTPKTPSSRREEILARIGTVPALPAAALRAMRLMQDPDVSVPALVTTIEYDASLTAGVLQQANSPFFGGMRKVATIKEAVVRLGINNLRRVVLAAAFEPMARQPILGYDLPPGSLWEHSVAVAAGVERLAAAIRVPLPAHAFTAAILIDVGKILLGTAIKVDVAPLIDHAYKNRVTFDAAEREVLGIDHAEVGATLLESWNLPAEVVSVVRWHHDPDSCPGDRLAVDLVHMADALAVVLGIGDGIDGLNYRPAASAAARFALPRSVRERVAMEVLEELERLKGRLGAAA
ncbi:MAG: HDOD domain-containing protein [Candidatus Eisenbacteria bacterium]